MSRTDYVRLVKLYTFYAFLHLQKAFLRWKKLPVRQQIAFALGFLLFPLLLCVWFYSNDIVVFLSYGLRPLWDTPSAKAFQVVTPHYYAPNVPLSVLCPLHGWTYSDDDGDTSSSPSSPSSPSAISSPQNHPSPSAAAQKIERMRSKVSQGKEGQVTGRSRRRARVFDMIPFAFELELLEIRLRELYEHVDVFVIIENDQTFTGLDKPRRFFPDTDPNFAFAKDKIRYKFVHLDPLAPGEDPFMLEGRMRMALMQGVKEAGIEEGDWVIVSDADEIPSGHTIRLISKCDGLPNSVLFNLNDFVYSFEFPQRFGGSYQAGIRRFDPKDKNFGLMHSLSYDMILADAGWHCSWCFRTVQDVANKMKGFAHNDRIHHAYFLEGKRIQDHMCTGRNIFDMLPEAFTWKGLVAGSGDTPSSFSAVNIPWWLVQNADRFSFLLPGGCVREDAPEGYVRPEAPSLRHN